jgi:hypothetical protein
VVANVYIAWKARQSAIDTVGIKALFEHQEAMTKAAKDIEIEGELTKNTLLGFDCLRRAASP